MTPRPRMALSIVAAVAFQVGACAPAEPPASPGSTAAIGSPVEGVVVDVDATGLTEVSAFTLRTQAGQDLRFTVGALENPVDFPPGHLATHLAEATRVRVFFRTDGGELVAVRLEDAQGP